MAPIPVPDHLEAFTQFDDVVSQTEDIAARTADIIAPHADEVSRAQALFEWVRDEIPHTKDIDGQVVTCTADEVLTTGTGICFAKAHLLAAMMRTAGIPCGFCYQVFENDDAPADRRAALHGLNAIYLRETGQWHRLDPRGNRDDVHAEFSLDEEQLAFPELEFLDECVHAAPLPHVVSALRDASTIEELWPKLPSVPR